jgi:hypothetical protein
MARPDDRDLYALERTLSSLASNPRIGATYGPRLTALRNAIAAARLTRPAEGISDSELDQFELLMARAQIAVQARKKELEIQLKQFKEREERLEKVLDAIDAYREKQANKGSPQSGSTASRKRNTTSRKRTTTRRTAG